MAHLFLLEIFPFGVERGVIVSPTWPKGEALTKQKAIPDDEDGFS